MSKNLFRFMKCEGRSTFETVLMILVIVLLIALLVPIMVKTAGRGQRSIDQTNSKYLIKSANIVITEHDFWDMSDRVFNLNKMTVVGKGEYEPISARELEFLETFQEIYNQQIPNIVSYQDCDFLLHIESDYSIHITDDLGRELYPNTDKAYR